MIPILLASLALTQPPTRDAVYYEILEEHVIQLPGATKAPLGFKAGSLDELAKGMHCSPAAADQMIRKCFMDPWAGRPRNWKFDWKKYDVIVVSLDHPIAGIEPRVRGLYVQDGRAILRWRRVENSETRPKLTASLVVVNKFESPLVVWESPPRTREGP